MNADIHQYFFGNYFNFKVGGDTSTTWSWKTLQQAHPNGLYVLGWIVNPFTRQAIRMSDKKIVLLELEQP